MANLSGTSSLLLLALVLTAQACCLREFQLTPKVSVDPSSQGLVTAEIGGLIELSKCCGGMRERRLARGIEETLARQYDRLTAKEITPEEYRQFLALAEETIRDVLLLCEQTEDKDKVSAREMQQIPIADLALAGYVVERAAWRRDETIPRREVLRYAWEYAAGVIRNLEKQLAWLPPNPAPGVGPASPAAQPRAVCAGHGTEPER